MAGGGTDDRAELVATLSLLPAPVWVTTGSDHRIVIATPATKRIIGPDVVGKTVAEVAALRGSSTAIVEMMDTVYRTEMPLEVRAFPVTMDGTERFFDLVGARLHDTGATVDGVFGFAYEVTDLVVARRRAEQAEAEAAAASRAKDEFLALLGHELRNPLAPIVTALELIRQRGDDASAREHAVITRQVEHLVRLVDDLLDVSRIIHGRIELDPVAIEISDIVADAIEAASPLIEERRHRLDVQAPRIGLLVDGDPQRLTQVLGNLLTNAAKYTEPGGRIRIVAERDGGGIAVHIKDTGRGIDPRMAPQLFDLFVQGREGVDQSHGGLGIGLAVVRSLVQLHGGRVSAQSDGPGKGSEFVVWLPAAIPTEDRPTQLEEPPRRAARAGRRILVVDDNEDASMLLADSLRAIGHEVHVARDGPSALDLAKALRLQVALLDIGLPVMDGHELGRRLRTLPGNDRVHLVAISGYGQPADRQRSLDAGFSAHLVKPVDLEEIERTIDDLTEE